MNTAIWIIRCQSLPMNVRERILKTESWEETLRCRTGIALDAQYALQ
jgi:hypothetical protein